jgi:hypothetical protein
MARKRYKPSVVFSCSALVVNQICGVPFHRLLRSGDDATAFVKSCVTVTSFASSMVR